MRPAGRLTRWAARGPRPERPPLDRASAAEALQEYERDGGTAAATFFEHLAAEARAEYGPGS